MIAAIGALALMAGTAFAQDSSVRGYAGGGGSVQDDLGGPGGPGGDDLGGVVQEGIGPRTGPENLGPAGGGPEDLGPAGGGPEDLGPAGDADSGSLPFTGFDLVLLIGGGVLLVAAGATLAGANRRRHADTA